MALFRKQDATRAAWTIAKWYDSHDCEWPLSFDDALSAVDWLRGFEPEDLRLVALQCDDYGALSRLADHKLIELLAHMIVSRELRVCGVRPVEAGQSGGGAQPAVPAKTPSEPAHTPSQLAGRRQEDPLHWIQIELVDAADQPVANEPYLIELPDGEKREGSLDANGCAYVGGIKTPGTCRVCFPAIDAKEWRAA